MHSHVHRQPLMYLFILFFGIMKVFSACEGRMLLVGNAANYSS